METMSIKEQPTFYRKDRIDSTDDDDADEGYQTDNEHILREKRLLHIEKSMIHLNNGKNYTMDSPSGSANWRQERPERRV